MQVIRPVGRDAAAQKYDLLTAMMAHAFAGDQNRQRLVLRLMALITARYNWQRDELATGQREIARLWCVDERTVKRDMARLRSLGWVLVKRQGARGRVSVLGLDLQRIWLDTRPAWENIGPDFVARAGAGEGAQMGEAGLGAGGRADGQAGANIVLFPRARGDARGETGAGAWSAAQSALAAEDPALYQAWFAGLADMGISEGRLHLIAPSRFHATYVRTHLMARLHMAVTRADATIGQVSVTAD